MSEGTCLGFVPIRAGVYGIGILQILYSGVRVGLMVEAGLESREVGLYMHFALHCLGLLAGTLLVLGILTNVRQMLLPWLLVTSLGPAIFMINLLSSLLFFQIAAVGALLANYGIPSLLEMYFCYVVYHMYWIMCLEEGEITLYDVRQLYSRDNVAFVHEAGGAPYQGRHFVESADLPPPSYNSVVQAHKAHVQDVEAGQKSI